MIFLRKHYHCIGIISFPYEGSELVFNCDLFNNTLSVPSLDSFLPFKYCPFCGKKINLKNVKLDLYQIYIDFFNDRDEVATIF